MIATEEVWPSGRAVGDYMIKRHPTRY